MSSYVMNAINTARAVLPAACQPILELFAVAVRDGDMPIEKEQAICKAVTMLVENFARPHQALEAGCEDQRVINKLRAKEFQNLAVGIARALNGAGGIFAELAAEAKEHRDYHQREAEGRRIAAENAAESGRQAAAEAEARSMGPANIIARAEINGVKLSLSSDGGIVATPAQLSEPVRQMILARRADIVAVLQARQSQEVL
jgi:hypothetical protein